MSRSEPGAVGRAARGAAVVLGLLLAITLASCLDTGPACGDGFCPSGTVCTAVGDRCVYPEQLEVCLGIVDDTTCVIRGNRDGMCRGQVCMPIVCGDGIAEGDEQCDGADLAGVTDCLGLADGYHQTGTLSCSSDCTYDRTACGPRCGDRIVQPGLEACDGPPIGVTCATEGFYGGILACSPGCQLDASGCEGTCGDGVRTAGEACDGFDVGDRSCTSEGFYGGQLRCATTSCAQVDTADCAGRCGDGVRNGDELCDGAAMAGLSCQSYGWYAGSVTCGDDCVSVDRSACTGYCGDGIKNGTELCDGLDQGGDSCTTFGAILGALGCNAYCQPTFDTCYWARLRAMDQQPMQPLVAWGSADDDIWAAGEAEGIAHFDGVDWNTIRLATSSTVEQIWGTARTDVWLYTRDGDLLHFDGERWSPVHISLGTSTSAWATAPDDIWIRDLAQPTLVSRFDGATWSRFDLESEIKLIWGTGPRNTWVITNTGISQFDGAQWTQHALTDEVQLVWGTSSVDVWVSTASGASNDLIRHFDGTEWSEPMMVGLDHIHQAWSRSPKDMWLVGTYANQSRAIRFDGTLERPMTSDFFRAMWRSWTTGDGKFWTVGGRGIMALDGPAWAGHQSETGNVTSLWVLTPTSAWANPDGWLHHFDGIEWRWLPGTPNHVRSVWAPNETDVWAGTSSSILHHDGEQVTSTPTAGAVTTVWGSSPNDVWAGGDIFMHWDGSEWTSARSAPPPPIRAIAGSDSANVWIISERSVFRYDGHHWLDMSLPVESGIAGVETPTSLVATAHDSAWVFSGAKAYHFDGSSWSSKVFMSESFAGSWGSSPRNVWAASERLQHFDGVTWSDVATGYQDTYRLVAGSSSSDVWLASEGGDMPQLSATLPTPYGGACAEPLRTFCNVSLRGHTAQSTDGPADCGAGAHAGGELTYKIEVPVTGRLTARVTSRHDVDLVALGADARGGCDLDACASEGADTEVEIEVRQGDVYYLVVGARDAAAPFTLDVACEKN